MSLMYYNDQNRTKSWLINFFYWTRPLSLISSIVKEITLNELENLHLHNAHEQKSTESVWNYDWKKIYKNRKLKKERAKIK